MIVRVGVCTLRRERSLSIKWCLCVKDCVKVFNPGCEYSEFSAAWRKFRGGSSKRNSGGSRP